MFRCEYADRLEDPPKIQVFATDIDEQAIAEARDGLYPSMIEADVSPERLREFFVRDHGRYRVRKEIREKVLFAAHNLLKDAPFSRCDLISCRNLLIYLTAKAQAQVFDVFHFALRSGELHLRLLEQYGPPTVVVNESHDIVHLSESAGRYLHFVAGEPTANVVKVINPALQVELRTALFRSAQTKQATKSAPQKIEIN